VIGKWGWLYTGRHSVESIQINPVQLTPKRFEGAQACSEWRLESFIPHRTPDCSTVRWTEGQRHYVSKPVQVIGIEIAADQTWTGIGCGIVDDRLQLIETLARIYAGVEMHVPDS